MINKVREVLLAKGLDRKSVRVGETLVMWNPRFKGNVRPREGVIVNKRDDNVIWGTYEELASEYYDPIRHPTCANFREASGYLLKEWLRIYAIGNGWLCETGPGRSLVAELLSDLGISLKRLILVDSSPSMLAHSKQWASRGAHFVLGDAAAMPLESQCLDLLVSSLGDPYNTITFWEEAYRVLRPGGISLFTTPSYDWALAFRSGLSKEAAMWAEFELSDGRRVRVPSLIHSVPEQFSLIGTSRLLTKDVADVPITAIKSGKLSPKLLSERGPNASVITGYVIRKPN